MTSPNSAIAALQSSRKRKGQIFHAICWSSTWFGIAVLAVLYASLVWKGVSWLDWDFLSNFDSRHPEQAGILAGLWGSLWLILLTIAFAVPIGIGAAVYLEEYAPDNWLTRLIQVNLANLAGIPSIVYGILGLTVFVRMFGVLQAQAKVIEVPLLFTTLEVPLPLGRTVISGALTLALLILPVIIVAAREALRAVPPSLRHASYALGATRWQTVSGLVLPAALPGILSGVILGVSRALGETAPLLMVGAVTYVAFTPGNVTNPTDIFSNPSSLKEIPFDTFTAMPILIFNWIMRPKAEYQHVAAAGILVLLFTLLTLNAAAILIRLKFEKRTRW